MLAVAVFQVARVEHTNFTYYYLSKDFTADILELRISSKPLEGCKGWNESEPVKVNIEAPISYGEDDKTVKE